MHASVSTDSIGEQLPARSVAIGHAKASTTPSARMLIGFPVPANHYILGTLHLTLASSGVLSFLKPTAAMATMLVLAIAVITGILLR